MKTTSQRKSHAATNENGVYTRAEILSQPEAWAAALEVLKENEGVLRALWQEAGCERVVFTGCGSTYYLSVAAAALLQAETGVAACALPASEIWLNPAALPAAGRTLLVAVSRSGETTETLQACTQFRARARGPILTLSCYPAMPLAVLGDVNLVFPSGQEKSVAQTRAFTTLYLATAALAAFWAGDAPSALWKELLQLPPILRRLLNTHEEALTTLGGDLGIDRFYMLGSGLRYGLACEISLKMKEMTLSHSEPFHAMEFRHGPKSMVSPSTLIIGLLGPERRAQDEAVLRELSAMGARTLTVAEDDADVALESGLSAAAQSVLLVPPGQLVALERALAKGLNPDRPSNLQTVVFLDAG